jgi:hypothetical protein
MLHRRVWVYVVRGVDLSGGSGISARLLAAATAIAESKGPSWARVRVAGRPVGAWLIAGTWLGLVAAVGWAMWW